MVELKGSRFTALLPYNLTSQPETQALAYAFSRQIDKLLEYAAGAQVLCGIDNMPAEVLDYLAAELRTPNYDAGYELEVKRQLVKNTLLMHYCAGTPKAVNLMIQVIFGAGQMQEWFECDEEPHYFRATGNTDSTIDGTEKARLIAAVNSVKRLSSWMEGVATVKTTADTTVYIKAAASSIMRTYLPKPEETT